MLCELRAYKWRCCSTLKDYYSGASKVKILRTDDFEMHEQQVYAMRESGAERKMLSSLVTVRSEGYEKKEIWVANVMLLCRCFVKGDTKGLELALVQYVECESILDAMDETLGCV